MVSPLKMNRNRRRNVQQPHGCLGRMVNLFDFGTVSTGRKLLTHKPFFDDGSLKRNQLDLIEDKVDAIGVNGTPIKKLLEEEMSKEMELTVGGGSTNLVAKLMGLDSFPHAQRSNNSSKPRLKRSLSHGECKDVYEVLDVEKKMDIVREKFLEAKRLVTDEKLRHSKEFREAMEVLSSNKELFLEFLQESNNFFSHHLHSFPEKSKRITILKPSKTIDDDDKLGEEAAAREGTKSEKGLELFNEEYPTKQSTRIVVLKPTGLVTKASSCPTSPRAKDVVRRVKREMLKDETSHSSVFSNGYTVDDSYDADSEIMSPVSRHSWDYINKYDSPFSSSSPFSRASGSPESSSVCREAKKRLSERWALMAASNESLQEVKVVEKKGGCISLGDMLALSDSVTDLRTEEAANDPGVSASCLPGREEGNSKPFKSLMRSKSLPESSSTSLGHNKGKSKVPELTKSKSLKWSLKGKVSNFLFSRNKKASSERSNEANPESLESRCNDESVSARSILSQEAGLSTCFPVSVLETSYDEDDEVFFNSSVLNRSSSSLEPEMMMSNLLGKSPSIGRNFSFNDSTVARCYSSKRSTPSTRDEEEDLRLLINTLLSASHLDEESSDSLSPFSIIDNLLSKWHSVESPLDPSLRESYAESTEHQRLVPNVKKLVFDLVNTLLLELPPSYLGHGSHMLLLSGKTLRGYVMNRMQECLKGKGRVEYRWWDEDGDLSSLAVNRVVRTEVAEIGSKESLRLEMECMGEEIELKLLEELVEEVLMDFSERSKSFIQSIC
ncbi:hypothetical protein Bca52824_030997 [Brassica carinata]|uniref:DUF4378 domain-containing protein n=1 Tax=Brassica carinata TaxID=52824 RepID=A0A8X7V798_BRACI|nr:hypothetical protein Bca52824_030997 [Brassica carinata]